jgi:spore maturation protein CgeB
VKFTIFGLTISSAWANGHATPWRALLKGLYQQGHTATFFERDVDYYAQHRDLDAPDFCHLVLYSNFTDIEQRARTEVQEADVAMVTSYCPDGLSACQLVLDVPGTLHVFYDMDTPVTLAALERDGLAIARGAHYLTPELIPRFDLYMSFTGGPVLACLQSRWGAQRTAALYGSVDPDAHTPVVDAPDDLRCTLGYLGTYAADRQPALEHLLLEPARLRSAERFLVVGSLYPPEIDWPRNVCCRPHLDPDQHPAFYSANRLTLSVSRQAMREWGYTPSGRLFEASSCGTPLLTDRFPGVEDFFAPGEEILLADTTEEALAALDLSDAALQRIGAAGRERTLVQHTGVQRARQLVEACEAVYQSC